MEIERMRTENIIANLERILKSGRNIKSVNNPVEIELDSR